MGRVSISRHQGVASEKAGQVQKSTLTLSV